METNQQAIESTTSDSVLGAIGLASIETGDMVIYILFVLALFGILSILNHYTKIKIIRKITSLIFTAYTTLVLRKYRKGKELGEATSEIRDTLSKDLSEDKEKKNDAS